MNSAKGCDRAGQTACKIPDFLRSTVLERTLRFGDTHGVRRHLYQARPYKGLVHDRPDALLRADQFLFRRQLPGLRVQFWSCLVVKTAYLVPMGKFDVQEPARGTT